MTYAVNQPDRRKTTALIVSAVAAVAFLLGLGLVVLLRGGGGNDVKTQAAAPTSVGPRRGDTERLTAENVQWFEVEGVRLPRSEAGPLDVAGRRAKGFARTPAGVVLAAVHISTRAGASFGPEVFRPTITEQVVGADKDQLLTKAEREYKAGQPGGVTASGALVADLTKAKALQVQFWGYRVDSFDPSVASVQLLSRFVASSGAPPAFTNFAVTMRWVDSDWRLVAPVNGDVQNTASRVPSVPAGYTVVGTE